jgi:hypothetical protein
MDQPKQFSAFLSGVSKKLFERNEEITLQYLKEQIFPNQDAITLEGRVAIKRMV